MATISSLAKAEAENTNVLLAVWHLIEARERVQIVKNDPEKWGVLKLGTQIVTDKQKPLPHF